MLTSQWQMSQESYKENKRGLRMSNLNISLVVGTKQVVISIDITSSVQLTVMSE